MDARFWHSKWEDNQIGFHQPEANALMVAHFDALNLPAGGRVFVPLCGKTRDIGWLLSQGYQVVGAELSELAVRDLFADLGIQPDVTPIGGLTRYSAPNIDIFAGDIFDLTQSVLGPVDAIYDRAALLALPKEMRARYGAHMAEITRHAPQFLICFEYDQSIMAGPPFSIDAAEVARVYQEEYGDLEPRSKAEVKGGLKGVCPAMETVWFLR